MVKEMSITETDLSQIKSDIIMHSIERIKIKELYL